MAVSHVMEHKVQGADRYLFDTKVGNQSGGTGQTFDWEKLLGERNYMLAGGLNSSNIHDAINTQAIGLDLNSGIETSPGKKCHQQIKTVFSKIKES